MASIFHLALASDWAAARSYGAYTTSTLGRTLAEEGFIHASRADQWTGVRDRFYADVTEPLVLLKIDTDLLDVPVIDEPPFPGASETFPHIYGRLPVSAVVQAIPLENAEPSRTPVSSTHASATTAATVVPPAAPQESFSRLYFREVFFNVALVCLGLVLGTAGLLAGQTMGNAGPAIGGVVGVVLGAVVGTALYRRRHRG